MGEMTSEETKVFNGIVGWILDRDEKPYMACRVTEEEKEIKNLSDDAKYHLQHVYRNFLQNIMSAMETQDLEAAAAAIWDASGKLRRLGL